MEEKLDKLYNVLVEEGLIVNDTFEKFKKRLNTEQGYADLVADTAISDGLYTGDKENFEVEYFSELKKGKKPEEEVVVQQPKKEEGINRDSLANKYDLIINQFEDQKFKPELIGEDREKAISDIKSKKDQALKDFDSDEDIASFADRIYKLGKKYSLTQEDIDATQVGLEKKWSIMPDEVEEETIKLDVFGRPMPGAVEQESTVDLKSINTPAIEAARLEEHGDDLNNYKKEAIRQGYTVVGAYDEVPEKVNKDKLIKLPGPLQNANISDIYPKSVIDNVLNEKRTKVAKDQKVRDMKPELDAILEDFENEKGVTAVGGHILGTIIEAGDFFDNIFLDDKSRERQEKISLELHKAIGTDASYMDAREKLNRLLKSKQDTENYEIDVNTYRIEAANDNLQLLEHQLLSYEKRANNNEAFTEKDVAEYNVIKTAYNNQIDVANQAMVRLGELTVEGVDFDEIKDKTLKTYSTLSVYGNNIGSSVVRIAGGLATLRHELTVPQLAKWAGYDINDAQVRSEIASGFDDFFGTEIGDDIEAGLSVINSGNQEVKNQIGKLHSWAEEIKDENREKQDFNKITNPLEFISWGFEGVTENAVNLGVSAITGGSGGLVLMALSESGNKMNEMNKEMEGEKWSDDELRFIQKEKDRLGNNYSLFYPGQDDEFKIKPKNISALQYFGTAGVYGVSEYVTEKITLGNFKFAKNNIKKAWKIGGKSTDEVGGRIINSKLNPLTKAENFNTWGKKALEGTFTEAGGEGIVTMSQNFADRYFLDKYEVSLLDGVTESMVMGAFMNGTMQSPVLLSQASNAFRSESQNALVAKTGAEILSLSKQRDKIDAQIFALKGSDPAAIEKLKNNRNEIQDNIMDLSTKQLENMRETESTIASLTPSDRQSLIDAFNNEHKVRKEIDDINENESLSKADKKSMINTRLDYLTKQNAKKQRVLTNRVFEADKQRGRNFATAWRTENNLLDDVANIQGNNNKETLEKGLQYIDTMEDLTDQEKNQVKDQMKNEFKRAEQESSGDYTVHGMAFGDNLTVETITPDGTKSTRKVNVPINFSMGKGNRTVQSHEMGHQTVFKKFMQNNPNATGLVNDMESYIKKNFKGEILQELKEVEEAYKDRSKAEIAEEKLARMSDFLRRKNIKGDRTLHNKMFGRFQKFNEGNGQINTGKDVFDMVTSYNQSFESGVLSGLAKNIAQQDSKSKSTTAKRSMTKAEQNKVEDDLNDAPGQRNKDGKYTMTKAEWRADKNRAFSKAYNMLMNGDLDGLIIAKMASGKDIYGQAREEFLSDARDKIGQHMLNFDPQGRDSLFGWVNSYIGRKVGDVANKAKREKAKTPGRKISTDQKLGEEGRTVAETIEGDTASDIEAAVDRSLNAKKKGIDNLRTRLGIEKGGKIYNKVVDSVKKVFGAKLPEVSNKNFKEALKKDFNTLLFKDIKNDIGTRAKYKEFIEGNITFKDADGNTKTMPRWEMLYDYISQSTFNKRFEPFIEPLINPETGNQARPDNNPLFTKKKITKEQWVEYFLGSKVGASTKGTRKDALASAIAQELAFDATMETISDPDIQNRIKDIYESQGLKQVENYLEQVAKEIDRKPDSKFSITKKPVVEKLQKHMEDSKGITPIEAFDNFYNKLNESDKQTIISERSAIENISKKEAKRFNRKIKEPKAKRKEEKKVLARQDQIVEEAGYKPLERRGEGRVDSIKYLMSSFFPKIFETFGDVSNKLIKPSNWSPSGNEAFSYYPDGSLKGGAIKRAQFFITSAIKTIKTIPGTLKAIEKGNLETLDAVKKLQKNTDLKNLPTEKKSNIETALKNQKTKDLDTNLKNRAQHKKGSIAYLSLLKEMYDADNNMLPGIQVLNYNQNANDASYRNLAQLIGVENGIEKGREEHIYQAGPWSTRVLQAITAKNPKVFEAFNKWQADNYYQETIAGKNKEGTSSESLIDDTYTMPDGSTWDSQSQEHPILKKALDEAMVTGDFSNVPSPDIRKYNEVFHLNPNNMIREGVSDATRYNVEVAEDLRSIPEVIELQAELIFLQLSGQMDATTAKGYLEAGIPIAKAKFSVTKDNKKMLNDSGVVDTSTELTNAEAIEQAGVLDDALNVARNPKAPIKKIRVFDFDDTLATTKSDVLYTAPDGTNGKLNAEEFATQGKELLDQGYKFDFSEFNKVTKGKPGPLLDIAKKIQAARGTQDVFVLTARAPEAQAAIKEFLDSVGLNIPLKNITGLGNSTGEAKAQWLVGKAAEGYNDFYFADDAMQNVRAVSDAMSQLDVKSKTQLAKRNNVKFSKSLVKKLDWKMEESPDGDGMVANFKIKDNDYLVTLYPVDTKGDYRYQFELQTKTGSTQKITGTGNAISVFSTVYNGLLDAVKSNSKIKRVEFSADKSEPSRVRVYTSVMDRFAKDLGWNTDIWETTDWDGGGSFDFEITKPRKKQVAPVEKVLEIVDVKSKVQQAKVKFSKTVDKTVNDIIEHKTGIKSESEYSDVKARLKGRKKGRFEVFIPPSAEDFVGLLYKMLGKGEIGNMQMDFFKEHLIEPYGRAMNNLSRDQNRMINDFKVLKDQLVKEGLMPKDLNKKAFGEYTIQDVSRVLAWNKQGFDVPGISKTDLKQILDYAKNNPAIDVFAQNLIDINKGDGYAAPNADWLGGTISTDLLDGLRTGKRSKYLQQWQDNVDLIFSNKNLNKMEAAFGTNWREAMEDMLGRMQSGRNRSNKMGRLENRLLDYINNSVGTVMFFNMRSALLQTISAINFIDFGSNNVFKAAKAFANQKQYWADFMELMNSEFLVERRNGLKLNVSESEIADAAANSKNKAKAAVAWILQKGYLPTQFADSFAIASGGATFFRNRIDALIKEGMSEADAKTKAFDEFREIAEESQQSSRPDRVSQQQASVLGRLILAFQNTPMQMNRLGKKAFLDLKNRRKRPGMTQFQSDMSNASRVSYYFAVQSAIFSALQQALFALAFNDDEEESEKERYYNIANGMLNTFLNGTGMIGVAASTLISVGRKVYKESAKEGQFPGPNYEDAANEMLNFSPPIDIKLSKLRQAGLTWKYEGYKHDEANWGIDDPAYKAGAYVVSGLTNVPLDRLVSKAENVRSAIEDEQQTWKRVSLLLGWRDYQLNSTEERQEYVTSQKEAKAAYRKKMKNKGKRQYSPKGLITSKQLKAQELEEQRLKYKKLIKSEQVRKLDSLGLTKKQIKSLKYEKDRVAKLIQLMGK